MSGCKLMIIMCFLLGLSSLSYSQIDRSTTALDESLCVENAADSTRGWQRVVLRQFSICIPPDLKRVSMKCFDGGCYRFENEQLSLDIDVNEAAWRPSSPKYLPSYKEEIKVIDGKSAWIWYFENDGTFRGKSGVVIKLEEKRGYALGVYLSSKEPGKHELARKIFKTIKFLPKIPD